MAEEVLSVKQLSGFIEMVLDLQSVSMDRLEEEILWFTQKFKSENADKPWGTSKDAPRRTVQKFASLDEHIT
jgi:hypothetical protein